MTSPVPSFRDKPKEVASLLAAGLRLVHSVDVSGCPFGAPEPNDVLVHGDACLPNVLVTSEAQFGFVDLGDAGCASRDVDLAAAVWSLQHNHGPGLAPLFLKEYGWPMASDEEVERLRRMYETG